MKYTFQYQNNTDRQQVLNDNTNKILIEEQNLFEGNFLIFTDEPIQIPLGQRVEDLKTQLATSQEAIDFLLMGGM